MVREIVTATTETIKLGITESQISSVRSRAEEETVVRVYADGKIGLASAVGAADLDALTATAKEGLLFSIKYPSPVGDRRLHTSHPGDVRTIGELVDFTEALLARLRREYPSHVFSHGVEQAQMRWTLANDRGLDLAYSRVTTSITLIVKEKGSGNIFDTFVAFEDAKFTLEPLLETIDGHLMAFANNVGLPGEGRQRVVLPGIGPQTAGGVLFKLVCSDLVARPFATGASVFCDKLGDASIFHPDLRVVDTRDASALRVCPFDMEGVARQTPEIDLIADGAARAVVANRRDAARFDLASTGSALGELEQLPISGVGRIVARPTAPTLRDLLGGQPALLVWMGAGGDMTRSGDLALPVQVLMRIEADGSVSGRYGECTLTTNMYRALGEDFVGVTEEPVDPFSEETHFVTHMDVQPTP